MNHENNLALSFRQAFMIIIIFVLCLFITNVMDLFCIIIILIIIYFLLFAVTDQTKSDDRSNLDIENFDSYKNREQRIKDLNDSRGKTGNFYVDCHPCGRARILEDRKKVCTGDSNSSRSYCRDTCKERQNESMSFFNNRYIDTNQTFCYNCLLDSTHNDRYFLKNYVYWPDIDDPVNGPPYL
jgi:hypothetical protein